MSKILKAVLISAYSTVVFQLLKTLIVNNTEEIIEIEYMIPTPGTLKKMEWELRKLKNNITAISMNFKMPKRLPTDLKYILKWTQAFSHYDSPIFKNGQEALLKYNCTYRNCYFTGDKSLLLDIRYFDAILFDVENYWDYNPILRSPHQKYIFVGLESADNFPVILPKYDSYYNLTWTYKLDSDIFGAYLIVLDKKGNIVGPKVNMEWINPMLPTSDNIRKKLLVKRKAAAWFVSNCKTKGRREVVAKNLSKELLKYGLSIDIYGWCGKLICSKDHMYDCLEDLENDYYFYLAFENSLAEDYVTEKILYPLLHYTVPIVYGGANYSRFLPPGSYIDAGKLNASQIASLMSQAIMNPKLYAEYFRWHNHYVYKEATEVMKACNLCNVLNTIKVKTSRTKFRKWWNVNKTNRTAAEARRSEDIASLHSYQPAHWKITAAD
ncbi:alpha-(1,3)-fucosyltransferase C-like [Galleria mellonella]|uniref:Fucosyltransferase n=1 Tax=Galleria mellonella TaxID=7137 RepID=A0ABM3MF41_GALME|nr:alpha-(1,3)-fucosyltransferase C-like [Galleria mellonella]